MGRPEHARGRAKFTPPKQALVSPWPARYLIKGTEENIRLYLDKYSQVAGVARRKSDERFSVIHHPPGFGGVNLTLPRATREAFASL
jgi:hypothetical protein